MATQEPHSDRIRAEQIRFIYRNTTPGTVTTFICVCVLTLALVYIDAAVKSKALVVIALMCMHTGSRLVLFNLYMRHGRSSANWRPWAFWFTVGAAAGGLTIGGGSVWMVSAAHPEQQIICLLLIFAVTSGAVGAFGAYLPAFYTFFVTISIVPGIWLFMHGGAWYTTIGSIFVLWCLAVAEQVRRHSRQVADSILLRFENLDLVEQLRQEKAAAEEANAAKSRFLAAASHDLRQPVHALTLFVAALRAHEMDEEARGLLDHIDGSVRSLGGLFGGLLDISRLDAGVVEVERTSFAIQPLIERVCRDYEGEAKAKGLRLRVHPTRAAVNSDPLLFERILRNIVSNAVAYTDRGNILVGCRRRGRQVGVQVRDTGRGIPPHEQQLVFQEFYQIGNPERDRTRGVGLGLAIVKRLTALLDHSLELRSRPGKGTCFTVAAPYATAPPMVDLETTRAAGPAVVRGSGLILVIDDEAAIQVAMKSLLQNWGYSVIAAGSCTEMLERIATHPQIPRLILCDYRLRDNETGSAAIERLRSEYNDEIPGMLITGDTAPDRIKEAQASGYLLLHKPVPNSKLRASITHLIQSRARTMHRERAEIEI